MTEAIENMIKRRSCRKYKPEQLDDTVLNKILEAGTYAPTGMGKQSPIIAVLQKPEDIDAVRKINAEVMGHPEIDPFYGAPTVAVVFGDTALPFGRDDGNLVICNLLNAAYASGVGSCYIWRARETFQSDKGKELKKKWGIPDNYEGVGNVILGYPEDAGMKEAPPRKADYIRRI